MLRRKFFTWEEPLLGQMVDYLAEKWEEGGAVGPLDLARELLIVPTRKAGRRLREALAAHAAERSGQALFPPRVLSFNVLLDAEPSARLSDEAPLGASLPNDSGRAASRAQEFLVWVAVLGEVDFGEFRAVFPENSPVRNFAWARGLAGRLLRLQGELRENDLGLVDVAGRLSGEHPEWARWQALAELERRQGAVLARAGLVAGLAVQRAGLGAALAALPLEFARVRVLAVPDPRPIALDFLTRLAERMPVEVCVYAAEGEAGAFDAWGRPIPEKWAERDLVFPDFEERVRVCADPNEQAARLAEAAALYYNKEEAEAGAWGRLALGVVDPELFGPLETVLREHGVPSYNPERRARRGGRLHSLLEALAGVAREDSFRALAQLARREPSARLFGEALIGAASSPNAGVKAREDFLAELDRVYERHLPPDVAGVQTWWRSGDEAGQALLARLAEYSTRLLGEEASPLSSGVRSLAHVEEGSAGAGRAAQGGLSGVQEVLVEIFAGRRFDPKDPADAEMIEEAEAWGECVREVEEALPLCAAVGGVGAVEGLEALDLAIGLYGQGRARGLEKAAGAVELQGWLELVWEEAPHLIVAGLNEGRVPSSVEGDLFLPESLRAQLGLKTNAQRLAVDAYQLQALVASREGSGGRLDVLLGRVTASRDPLRPSRLLLRCGEEALPGRVGFLFKELPAAEGASLAWARAWQLRLPEPGEVALPAHFPVTGLQKWLECPLRFYLSRVLKLQAVDSAKVEMAARDFGTLCHAALEAMGREAAQSVTAFPSVRSLGHVERVAAVGEGELCGCTDVGRLQRFLGERLDTEVARQFGRRLSMPLVVQVEAARQRLAAAAVVQARLHEEGWRILRVEWEFEMPIGGLVFRGKIDRVDVHEASGALRVIDYKTSEAVARPEKVHLENMKKGADVETVPPWRLWAREEGKPPLIWADLQLPVYERVVAGEFPGRDLRCGYFHLPKAVADTGLSLWEGYSPELAASAWGCAEGVAAAIARREFWPPRELRGAEAERDEFASLFQRGAAESVTFGASGAASGNAQSEGGGAL